MLKFGLGELMLMMKITEPIRPICETSQKLIENSQQYIEKKFIISDFKINFQ